MGVGASIGVAIGLLAAWVIGMFIIGKSGAFFRRLRSHSSNKTTAIENK
jgi:hypothetical protein